MTEKWLAVNSHLHLALENWDQSHEGVTPHCSVRGHS